MLKAYHLEWRWRSCSVFYQQFSLRSPFAIVLFCFLIFLLFCFLAPWLLLSRRFRFSCLGCRAVLRFSPPFLTLAAIFLPYHFNRCRPFYRGSTSNIAAFHSRLDLELPFFCSGPVVAILILLLKIFSLWLPVAAPFFFCLFFFSFLVVVLLVIFMPSCCSYCHCSTGSNSHTVVLSNPASYSSALFSVPVIIREHAYQYFMVLSRYGESTAVVCLQ